jgi:hypothetical protein
MVSASGLVNIESQKHFMTKKLWQKVALLAIITINSEHNVNFGMD